ncbi:hypothetical protein Z043_100635, partial [Scleropages formosus]
MPLKTRAREVAFLILCVEGRWGEMLLNIMLRRREDDAALEICCAPEQSDKPCADSERAQKWRMSLASLLFFTVLLSDHLWLCAGVKLLSKDRSGRRSWGSAAADEEEGGGHAVRNNGLHSHAAAPATRDPACADAGSSSRLESACAALHWRGAGSWVALAAHNRSALSPHALLAHFRAFSLSFCDSYTMSDLLVGMAEPDGLNCSLQNMVWDLASGRVALDDDEDVCGSCIQAYMRLDQHAQEKYEEFELLFLKYLPEDYSVRSRLEDCKVSARGSSVARGSLGSRVTRAQHDGSQRLGASYSTRRDAKNVVHVASCARPAAVRVGAPSLGWPPITIGMPRTFGLLQTSIQIYRMFHLELCGQQ